MKVKILPAKRSEKETFVSYLLIQWLVVWANVCNISFDECKGQEMRVYPPAL